MGFHKEVVIRVEGEPPKLAGWSFIARLTPTPAGNLISKVPTLVDDVPEYYRTAPPYCDYCKKIRRRTDSFIVRNDKTGEYKQIGRNCLAKFLGYSNPERVARYASWLTKIREEISEQEEELISSGGGGHSDYEPLDRFLAYVVAVVDWKGWVSLSNAQDYGKTATIQEVYYQMSPPNKYDRSPRITPTDEHYKKAKEIIEWARSDKLTTDTDFKHNLKISMAKDMFHRKASAVVASIVNFHDRDKEWERMQQTRREEREKELAEQKKSEYVGSVGERITVAVDVVRRIPVEGDYGISYLFRMIDPSGDVLVWFASNDVLEEGKRYNITGRVKKHQVYEGIKQTYLTRCKAEEIPSKIEDIIDDDIDVVDNTPARKRKHNPRKKSSHTHSEGKKQPATMISIR